MVTEAEPDVGVVQFGSGPFLVHGIAEGVDPGRVQTGEGLAPPEAECPPEQGSGLLVLLTLPGRPGLCREGVETVQIHCRRLDVEDIAAGPPDDSCPLDSGQRLPETGKVAVEGIASPLRRTVGPDAVGEPADRDHLVGLHQQYRQNATLPGMAQIDDPALDTRLDTAEQIELDRHRTPRVSDPHSSTALPTSPFNVRPRFAD